MKIHRRSWLLKWVQGALGAAFSRRALADTPLAFPRDHGAHPHARTEWWYATGSLQDEGRLLGFQVTFFRSRTGLAEDIPSRFAARQLLFAHAAVSDLAQGRLRHDQRVAREGFGLAEASERDTSVVLRDWSFVREAAPGGSVYRTRVESTSAGFSLALAMKATQPPMLQGRQGLSRKGASGRAFSHYVSEPQLEVSGRLALDGRERPVTGRAWLDHEWSDGYLPAGAVGWDWTGMNLDDGSALMAFRMRDREGRSLWSGGGFRAPGGPVQSFEGVDAAVFQPGRRWTSPATGASYPVRWTVQTPAGRFEVRALLDAQELDSRASTGTIYWEGLAELLDAATGRRLGRGYLEMTGYAQPLSM